MSKKDLEIFLYKNKLNTLTLIDILPNLSSKTISNLVNDLNVLLPKSTEQSDKIHVFTDGNCKKNGKTDSKGGYGIFFTEDENSILYQFNTVRKLVENPTNQKAELSAILKLFKIVDNNHDIFKNKEIVVCTDSMYSINCITKWSLNWELNNWKTSKGEDVKNASIIKMIMELKKNIESINIKISFKHVFSHVKKPENENSLEYFYWYGNNKVDNMINEILDH
jgi:ribonuclease HI